MNFQVVILFCFALYTDTLGKKIRIVSGSITSITNHPYQVAFKILSANMYFCGGSIITQRHILSAAHCFHQRENLYNDMRVLTGITNLNTINPTMFRILQVNNHPDYTGVSSHQQAWLHDISVVTLQTAIIFNQYQNKINLPTEDIHIHANAEITGWGKTNAQSLVPSNELRKLTVTIISIHQCQNSFQRLIKSSQICTIHNGSGGSCTGDSGSPLVLNGKVVGILSWIVPCAMGYPDIFTDVYDYKDFIDSIITLPYNH